MVKLEVYDGPRRFLNSVFYQETKDGGISFFYEDEPEKRWTCYPCNQGVFKFLISLEEAMKKTGWITPWDAQEIACKEKLATYTKRDETLESPLKSKIKEKVALFNKCEDIDGFGERMEVFIINRDWCELEVGWDVVFKGRIEDALIKIEEIFKSSGYSSE